MKPFPQPSKTLLLSTALGLISFVAPAHIRADVLYVGNYLGNTIQKYNSSGIGSVFANTDLNSPIGLAFDSAGNLYAANYDGRTIAKFNSVGAGSLFASTYSKTPGCIAFDSAGNLYVAYTGFAGGVHDVEKFSSSGTDLGAFVSITGSPYGLAFASGGDLYVTDRDNDTIAVVTPGGAASTFASMASSAFLDGIAFDSTGNLYLANIAENTIEKFTPGGVGSVFASGLDLPAAVAFDSAGCLYVANFGSNTVQKFSATGTDLGVFASTGLNGPAYLAFTDDAGVPLKLPNQVPEPANAALIGLGTLLLATRRKRRVWNPF